jgi:sugar-specific transcriptional regulator TrmB/DNA-binding CsgD family transcriptional regulator
MTCSRHDKGDIYDARESTMLDVLGLDDPEATAYKQLIEVPDGTADDLAAALGWRTVEARRILSSLEDKGLVARATSGPGRFVASPPAIALGALVVQRQDELRSAQLELAALTERYRGAARERSVSDVVDVVRGPQAVRQRFLQLQRTAEREVQMLVKSDFVAVTPEEHDDEEVAVARGVSYRVVVERANLERPGFFEGAVSSIESGVEARVTQSLPLRMIIADRQLGLVPLFSSDQADQGGGALMIHPSGLLDALQLMFDLVWQGASRLVISSDGVGEDDGDTLEDVDAQVLGLLLAGLTDQAIGNQLGLSLRTVQRRVSQLMERAKVATRLQLGHEAGRRGWL